MKICNFVCEDRYNCLKYICDNDDCENCICYKDCEFCSCFWECPGCEVIDDEK